MENEYTVLAKWEQRDTKTGEVVDTLTLFVCKETGEYRTQWRTQGFKAHYKSFIEARAQIKDWESYFNGEPHSGRTVRKDKLCRIF